MTFSTANKRNVDIHIEEHHLPFAWRCMECLCTIPKQAYHKDGTGRGCKNRTYQCVDKEQKLEGPAALSRYHKWTATTKKSMWRITRKGAARKEAQRIRDAFRKSFSPVRMTSPEVFVGEATVKKRKFEMTERGDERKMTEEERQKEEEKKRERVEEEKKREEEERRKRKEEERQKEEDLRKKREEERRRDKEIEDRRVVVLEEIEKEKAKAKEIERIRMEEEEIEREIERSIKDVKKRQQETDSGTSDSESDSSSSDSGRSQEEGRRTQRKRKQKVVKSKEFVETSESEIGDAKEEVVVEEVEREEAGMKEEVMGEGEKVEDEKEKEKETEQGCVERMRQITNHPVKIVVGGIEFATSEYTLRTVKEGLLAKMVEAKVFRKDGKLYVDREALHFRYILNFLRNGGRLNGKTLPGEERFLYEIMEEAQYFKLPGLVETVRRRINEMK